MTNYEKIHNMTKEELAIFLENNGKIDEAPWDNWFLETYCNNCEPVLVDNGRWGKAEECFCNEHKKCRLFPGRTDYNSERFAIDLWLNKEENR